MNKAQYILEMIDCMNEFSQDDYHAEVTSSKKNIQKAKERTKKAKSAYRQTARKERDDIMHAKIKRAGYDKKFARKETGKLAGLVGGAYAVHKGVQYGHGKAKEHDLYGKARRYVGGKISGES
jgi:hypothetical protein